MKVAFKSSLVFSSVSSLGFVRSLSNEQLELVGHLWKFQGFYLKLWCLLLTAAIRTVQLKREQVLASVSPLLTWQSPYRAPRGEQFPFHLCVKPLLCEVQNLPKPVRFGSGSTLLRSQNTVSAGRFFHTTNNWEQSSRRSFSSCLCLGKYIFFPQIQSI